MIATVLHWIYNQIQQLYSETHRIQIGNGAPYTKMFKTPPEPTDYNIGRGHQFAGWELFEISFYQKVPKLLSSCCVFCSSLLITSSITDAELFTCVFFSASFTELSLRRLPQILWKASYRLMAIHHLSLLFSNFRCVLNGKTHSKGENR